MSEPKKYLKKSFSEKKTLRVPSLKIKTVVKKVVREDLKALEEIVQCGICLERLADPRMLPCQHTFCLTCLKTHFIAKNLVLKSDVQQNSTKVQFSSVSTTIICPMCQSEVELDKGYESLDKMPKNLYIESLLKLLDSDDSPISPKPADFRCVKCQTVSERQEHVCQHCMQIYCPICWTEHILELDTNLTLLVKQIEDSGNRLKHKSEIFSIRCNQLTGTIKESVEQKLKKLKKKETELINEVETIKSEGNIRYENINTRIKAMKEKIEMNIINGQGSNSKITTYMNLHRETAKLFNEIYHYGEARLIFDSDKFRIEQATEGIYKDVTEDNNEALKIAHVENPFESNNSMIKHYKSRNFVPKLLWSKCPRPGGVNIAPWDNSKVYIAATDSRNILILDRTKFRLVGRINHPEMMCPTSLAFSKSTKDIFVTDKWKNCVHVFSPEGEYLRNACNVKLQSPDGVALGPNDELIICDTGNGRIVVVDSQLGDHITVIGKGELNSPSSVAVHGKHIIVADTGNNRIKIFNMNGQLLQEIGSFGSNKGQFRSAEVVAVDCLGFILVGDAGNARIQVFQPDGTFVKIFGGTEGFGWISGICVTPELDIITTDNKNKNLRIF